MSHLCKAAATAGCTRGALAPTAAAAFLRHASSRSRSTRNITTRAAAPGANGSSSSSSSSYDYDAVIIGAGSAGVRAARTAAEKGARVAVVELPMAFLSSADKGGVGGTCVLRGCVPKKLLLFATEFKSEIESAKGFGWTGASAGELDWGGFMAAKREELSRINKGYKEGLDSAGVELLEGRGVVKGPHEVEVDGRSITTRNIVIATGGQPSHIPIPGAEHAIISDQVLELEALPKVVTLIGGGYIGMEFAGMFARLGCEVHVVARQSLPLAPRFDKEVCEFFMEQCTASAGIHMHMNCNPTDIIREADGSLTVKLAPAEKKDSSSSSSSGGGEIRGNAQVVLAVGRAAKTKGLGLEEIGVEMGPKGSVKVDAHSRTNVPSIWAVGDVTSRIALTPVAKMEGQAVGLSIATGQEVTPSYEAVPSACFSWPYVATVGLTEEEAAKKGLTFEVYSHTFSPLRAHLAARAAPDKPLQRCFVKMLTEPGAGKLLGLHMVGEEAPEIIQGFALALKLGSTKQQLDSLVGIHPTSAEEVLGLKGPVRMYKEGKQQQQDSKQEGMNNSTKAQAAGQRQAGIKAEGGKAEASRAA
uniref:Glutathione-disulfide reductase n=1 Tax=Tetradesmus obliquus TaxID=3088 RepID=A0A383VZR7_TETOB|eukprot:jgi/Sobl393_1/4760/SZX70332.1